MHAGPVGAGHFSKMVHNGIEYAMMQAYGEGYELLAAVDLIEDVPGVIASWTQGTVIRSWLLDLLVRALQEDPELERITGYAEDSGEGRWTVEQAHRERRPDADDRRVAVRPVRLPPGRLPDHEGRRGAAQPVRRARGARRPGAGGREARMKQDHPAPHASQLGAGPCRGPFQHLTGG